MRLIGRIFLWGFALLGMAVTLAGVAAIVAALARRQMPLPAFTIGFEGLTHDESDVARTHAHALGLDLEVIPIQLETLAERLPDLISTTEFAPVNTHGVARHQLSAHIRERGIKVVLSGEGSDELFAGYPFFLAEARWRQTSEDVNKTVAGGQGVGVGLLDGALTRHPQASLPWASFIEQRVRQMDSVPPSILQPKFQGGQCPSQRAFADIQGSEGADPLNLSRLFALRQLQDYLLPALGDRVEMAHGVEGRPVFLDREIIEFAAGCSETELLDLDRGQGKRLVRHASAKLLPEAIANVRKHPFLAPS